MLRSEVTPSIVVPGAKVVRVVDLGIAVVIVVNLGNVVTLVGLEIEGNVVEAGSVIMSSMEVYCAAVDKKKSN